MYRAEVRREGKLWLVEVPAIDGLTQARRLSEAQLMARELIAVTLGVPLSEVDVEHVPMSAETAAEVFVGSDAPESAVAVEDAPAVEPEAPVVDADGDKPAAS